MQRLAVALLLGGALLIATWVAADDPPQRPQPATPSDAVAPILADVNAEVEQLRERLTVDRRFTPPGRDPFRFRTTPEPRVDVSTPAVPAPVVVAPLPMPELVAILTDKTDVGMTRRAVFSFAGTVHIVKAGDAVDRFVVARVDADGVDLTERETSTTVRVTIK